MKAVYLKKKVGTHWSSDIESSSDADISSLFQLETTQVGVLSDQNSTSVTEADFVNRV